MRYLPLMSALILVQCVRGPNTPPTLPEEDKSIVFPKFFGEEGVTVGDQGKLFELDGITLRALMVAVSDFLPSDSRGQHCWTAPEGYRYRVVREGDVIFIRIYADTDNCERGFMAMDDGVRYAISADGRILRRLFTGEPEGLSAPAPPGAADAGIPQGEDLSNMLGATRGSSSIAIPLSWLDGGSGRARDSQVPSPSVPDGGTRRDGGSLTLPSQ